VRERALAGAAHRPALGVPVVQRAQEKKKKKNSSCSARDAQQVGDHQQRERGREPVDELALAAGQEGVQHAVGQLQMRASFSFSRSA